MRQDEYHQLELERMQRLDEALERAEAGHATGDDWDIIRFECGSARRPSVYLMTIGIKNDNRFRNR
jgi:hypothetical protein